MAGKQSAEYYEAAVVREANERFFRSMRKGSDVISHALLLWALLEIRGLLQRGR